MAGHSRWAQVKHKKAASDQKRGERFSKISRLITMAVKSGGVNPSENFKLRDAMEKAKSEGMGGDTVERAIERGLGGGGAQELSEALYEGYGPGGTAILIQVLSDNLNRTNHELRKIVEEHGGKLVSPGAVSWMFEPKVVVDLELAPGDPEEQELSIIDAGAEEIERGQDRMVAIVNPERFPELRQTLSGKTAILGSALEYVPRSRIKVEDRIKDQITALVEKLDQHNDVHEVYTNADI